MQISIFSFPVALDEVSCTDFNGWKMTLERSQEIRRKMSSYVSSRNNPTTLHQKVQLTVRNNSTSHTTSGKNIFIFAAKRERKEKERTLAMVAISNRNLPVRRWSTFVLRYNNCIPTRTLQPSRPSMEERDPRARENFLPPPLPHPLYN